MFWDLSLSLYSDSEGPFVTLSKTQQILKKQSQLWLGLQNHNHHQPPNREKLPKSFLRKAEQFYEPLNVKLPVVNSKNPLKFKSFDYDLDHIWNPIWAILKFHDRCHIIEEVSWVPSSNQRRKWDIYRLW